MPPYSENTNHCTKCIWDLRVFHCKITLPQPPSQSWEAPGIAGTLNFILFFPLKPVVAMIEAGLRLERGRTPFWVRERCVKHHSFIIMLLSDAGVEGWDLGDGLGGSASPLGCKEDLRGKNWGFCGYAGSFLSLKGPKIGRHCPMAQPSSSSLCQGLMLGFGMWSRGPCPPPGTLPQGAAL